MPKIKKETREMRVRDVPLDVRRKIAAHQKILSVTHQRDVTVDEACVDLWVKATANIPAFKS